MTHVTVQLLFIAYCLLFLNILLYILMQFSFTFAFVLSLKWASYAAEEWVLTAILVRLDWCEIICGG